MGQQPLNKEELQNCILLGIDIWKVFPDTEVVRMIPTDIMAKYSDKCTYFDDEKIARDYALQLFITNPPNKGFNYD